MSMTFKQPKKTCDDRNCPFHGTLAIRGRVLDGKVHTAKMDKTVIVDREFLQFSSKFSRYERQPRSHPLTQSSLHRRQRRRPRTHRRMQTNQQNSVLRSCRKIRRGKVKWRRRQNREP